MEHPKQGLCILLVCLNLEKKKVHSFQHYTNKTSKKKVSNNIQHPSSTSFPSFRNYLRPKCKINNLKLSFCMHPRPGTSLPLVEKKLNGRGAFATFVGSQHLYNAKAHGIYTKLFKIHAFPHKLSCWFDVFVGCNLRLGISVELYVNLVSINFEIRFEKKA